MFMSVATMGLIDKCDGLQMKCNELDKEVAHLEWKIKLMEKTLKALLEHFELQEVRVEAFTQLVKVPKP